MCERIRRSVISCVLIFILLFVGMWMTVSQTDSFFSCTEMAHELTAASQGSCMIPSASDVLFSGGKVVKNPPDWQAIRAKCGRIKMQLRYRQLLPSADCCTQELLEQQGTVMTMISSRVQSHRTLLRFFKIVVSLLMVLCALWLMAYICGEFREILFANDRIIRYIHDRDGKKKSIIYEA